MERNLVVEDTYFGSNRSLNVGNKLLDLSAPIVMGIVNMTPDSFYRGSRMNFTETAMARVNDMLMSGATVIDVGGYSSRPGAEEVSVQEELDRTLPIIEQITKAFPEAILSIDTFRGVVAEYALSAGAKMINDISGFGIDPLIATVAGKHQVPYILTHMRGTPKTMQSMTTYKDLFSDVVRYFTEKMALLKDQGVKDIILDPGFGFSKTIDQNHFLLRHLDAFDFLDSPILVGVSRKSMIYKKLEITPDDSLNGTIALNSIALSKGASILRVHDVREAVEIIRLLK